MIQIKQIAQKKIDNRLNQAKIASIPIINKKIKNYISSLINSSFNLDPNADTILEIILDGIKINYSKSLDIYIPTVHIEDFITYIGEDIEVDQNSIIEIIKSTVIEQINV